QLAGYDYTEPGVAEIKGNRLGLVAVGTLADGEGAFGKIDFRFSVGSLDYKGSGTLSGVPDVIVETRAVAGYDIAGEDMTFSPYLALGSPSPYTDPKGRPPTAAAGSRRYSNYLYAPIGATARFDIGSGWALAPTAEYDVFLRGQQKSMLSDASPALGDVTNT